MYIAPNSTIHLLRGVKLDNTYQHTIYFMNDTAQYNYFSTKINKTLDSNSYQRTERGWLRISCNISDALKSNYMMYKNTNFENKWFYAFILERKYINNAVTEIQYEIDVMQTWFLNCKLSASYVEREHIVNDAIGANIVAENIDIGNDYDVYYTQNKFFGQYHLFAALSNYDENDPSTYGDFLYGGNNPPYSIQFFSGLSFTDFGLISNIAGDNETLKKIHNLADKITLLYLVPAEFISSITYDGTYNSVSPPSKVVITCPFADQIAGHYTAKNNKLYTAPFSKIRVSNNSGSVSTFKFEEFKGANNVNSPPVFTMIGSCIPDTQIMIYPNNHNGQADDYISAFVLNTPILCPFNIDTYRSFWNQNINSYNTKALTTTISDLAGGALGAVGSMAMFSNPATGAIAAGVSIGGALIKTGADVANNIAQVQDLKNAPDSVSSQASLNTLNVLTGRNGFTVEFISIKQEFLKIVDDYFSVYGYATHKVKIPNISARPHWNYVKTIGANITGNTAYVYLPSSDDIAGIKKIFDNGITFWKNGDEIGDYSFINK